MVFADIFGHSLNFWMWIGIGIAALWVFGKALSGIAGPVSQGVAKGIIGGMFR